MNTRSLFAALTSLALVACAGDVDDAPPIDDALRMTELRNANEAPGIEPQRLDIAPSEPIEVANPCYGREGCDLRLEIQIVNSTELLPSADDSVPMPVLMLSYGELSMKAATVLLESYDGMHRASFEELSFDDATLIDPITIRWIPSDEPILRFESWASATFSDRAPDVVLRVVARWNAQHD